MATGFFLIVAVRDLGWRLIDNGLVLALLGLWAGFAALRGLTWQDVGGHLAVGGGAFIAMVAIYALNWIGGGDVKLTAPVFLWAGSENGLAVLLVVGLGGALLGLTCALAQGLSRLTGLPKMISRVLALLSAERGVPYGVALAAGGVIAVLAAMAEG